MTDEPLQEVTYGEVRKINLGNYESKDISCFLKVKLTEPYVDGKRMIELQETLSADCVAFLNVREAEIRGGETPTISHGPVPVNKQVCSACLGNGNAKDGEMCAKCQGTGLPSHSSPAVKGAEPKADVSRPQPARKPPQDEGLSVSHRLAEVGFVPSRDKAGLYYKRIGQEIAFADLRETTKYPYYATKEGAGFLHKKDMSNEVVKALEDAEEAVADETT